MVVHNYFTTGLIMSHHSSDKLSTEAKFVTFKLFTLEMMGIMNSRKIELGGSVYKWCQV